MVRAPANFSQSLLRRLASAMDASNETLSQSSVNVSIEEIGSNTARLAKKCSPGCENFSGKLVSYSRNKIHKTWGLLLGPALYNETRKLSNRATNFD